MSFIAKRLTFLLPKLVKIVIVGTMALGILTPKRNNKDEEQKIDQKSYSINLDKTSIHWTAYKTTDKVPVKGQFNKFHVENLKKGASVKDVLNGLKFSIPVSSIFSKDSIRDGKLNTFFFDIMKNIF